MSNGDEALNLPSEIPWQLAATTMHLGPETHGPDTTAISIFSHVPTLASLEKDYPDDQLILFKFIVSVSPMLAFHAEAEPNDPLQLFTADPHPIWRLLFDLRISPVPYVEGGSRPYFLTAAPLRRAMIQTGVVGQQSAEGESKSLAIGKSGSQMHEGYSSTVDTTTNSAGASWVFGSASTTNESSTASGSRDVVQHIDTTQRNASTERQELVSHMTNVTNILTLLSAFDVGSPYVRFSLWSPPLQPLTIDPSDPSLWYAELLRRRSSGIEGIQEFFAIAAVPRSLASFCIEAQLRRYAAVPPPLPSGWELAMPVTAGTLMAPILTDYLENRYPLGTPIDDLDVEPVPLSPPKVPANKPVIGWWEVSAQGSSYDQVVLAHTIDATGNQLIPQSTLCHYKTAAEVWLDMKKEEFERALLQSPLAHGSIWVEPLKLKTCFGSAKLEVMDTKVDSAAKPSMVKAPQKAPKPGPQALERKIDRYRQAVFAWNAAENRAGAAILHAAERALPDLRFDDPTLVEFALQHLAGLDPEDAQNQTLKAGSAMFGISAEQVQTYERKGLRDVRTLAEAILLAPRVDRANQRRKVLRAAANRPVVAGVAVEQQVPAALRVVLSVADAYALRTAFGAALHSRAELLWSQ